MNDPKKPKCNVCRDIYEKKHEDPPCEKCVPAILPGNEDALRVYLMVRNQVIVVGMGTPIDLDFNAIEFILNLYKIRNKKEVFEKVIMVSRYILEEAKEK